MTTALAIAASILLLGAIVLYSRRDNARNRSALSPVLLEDALDPDLRRLLITIRQQGHLPHYLRAQLAQTIVDIAAHRAALDVPPNDGDALRNAWQRLEQAVSH